MTDKKFEELLKEAVEQCVEKEWEEISQKSKKIRYKPSKEFEEKMEKLYQKESCQNNFIGDEQTKSKSQLKDTKSEIINMKPTEEGKKERERRLKKKCIMEIKGLLMFGLINNIYFLPDGIGIYFLKILEWTLGSIILVAIIAIIENKKIEDKVKKLNQME